MRRIARKSFNCSLFCLLVCIVTLFSSCGTSYEKPVELPPDDTTISQTDLDRVPVNFYYDNTVSEYLINKNDKITKEFFQSMFTTPLESKGEYALRVNDDRLELYNLLDNNAISDPVLREEYANDDFYIKDVTKKMKEDFGMINMVYLGENSCVDKDAVTVVFTDLSEVNISETADAIYNTYLKNDDYSACLLGISLSIRTDDPHPFYYLSSTAGNIGYADRDLVRELGERGQRNYYLFMTGPSPYLAAYVLNLQQNLSYYGFTESDDVSTIRGYSISEFNYLNFAFSNEENLDVDTDIIDNADISAVGDPFENYTIRLKKEIEDDVYHFSYNKDMTGGLPDKQGYNGAKTYDFSLNAQIDVDIEGYETIYVNYEDYARTDGTWKGNEELPEPNGGEPAVYYSLGEAKCFYGLNGDWQPMSEERSERFFKMLRTDGNRITVISDNTDEEGIDNIYIRIPVYQVVSIDNFPASWAEKRSLQNRDDVTSVLTPLTKTVGLRYFYGAVFGLSSTNNEQTQVDKNSKIKIMRSCVGYAKIVITDIA